MTNKHSYEMKKQRTKQKSTKKNILPPIQRSMNFFVQKKPSFRKKRRLKVNFY
ncbi:hypothetical protein D356_01626 [Enterococcus faecium SD2A-2]|uniref:30S ribosomal protein S18 domain protein n=1 Tax=Enterococcus faecium SD2A-2 TaxID=1244154 RepID=A0AB73A9E6_ENTFC|nr:hypothetical protein HMPREF1345_02294 [Enterococcus faecium TX1337RF]EPI12177.1 hypothetical protein D356_01626 [Enterococcus faecium SD2A-2]KXA05679.1 hypothetical protein HMPREF3199_02628 [Enterococcus faecium]MBL4989707.1 hypothetical protein [Enterococcus lactis]MBL4992348.1 hypothetical protein [Enterococcus lactis]